jgi:hypothetical protein
VPLLGAGFAAARHHHERELYQAGRMGTFVDVRKIREASPALGNAQGPCCSYVQLQTEPRGVGWGRGLRLSINDQ